jgi:hypothetical protein
MEDDFKRGDELAVAGDRVALEYGWWADGWLAKEAKESNADNLSRAAFSYALTVLEGRHGHYLSRSQITDRIRIGRAFPETEYKDLSAELHYDFTFSQLRAAFVRDDPKRTMELLLWAAENDAEPLQINEKKIGGIPETEEVRAWRHVVEWCRKYLDRCNPGIDLEKCVLARAVVDFEDKCHIVNDGYR